MPDSEVARPEDTAHGLGWESAAGLTFPLNQRLGLTPGVRCRTLSRDITMGGLTRSATLSYVMAGVGLSIAF